MTFVKGQSGNPGGRPKGYLEVRQLALRNSKKAFKTLTELAQKAESEAARIAAASAILDRAFGKPASVHTGEGGQGPILASLEVTFVKSECDDKGDG